MKIQIATVPTPIPSHPPIITMLEITATIQIKLNILEVLNNVFLETLRNTRKMTIANAIPTSNIGVHPYNIKASIL